MIHWVLLGLMGASCLWLGTLSYGCVRAGRCSREPCPGGRLGAGAHTWRSKARIGHRRAGRAHVLLHRELFGRWLPGCPGPGFAIHFLNRLRFGPLEWTNLPACERLADRRRPTFPTRVAGRGDGARDGAEFIVNFCDPAEPGNSNGENWKQSRRALSTVLPAGGFHGLTEFCRSLSCSFGQADAMENCMRISECFDHDAVLGALTCFRPLASVARLTDRQATAWARCTDQIRRSGGGGSRRAGSESSSKISPICSAAHV